MANESTIEYLAKLAAGTKVEDKFVLPTTRDFRSTELPYRLKKKNTADLADMLYFIEHPYSDTPGYYPEDTVFVVKGIPDLSGEDLGSFDADTLYFPIENISDNGAQIVYNGNTFSILDYLKNSVFNDDRIGVRFVGINAPETNKFRTISADNVKDNIISKTVAEIKDNDNYCYDESTVSSESDIINFIKIKIDNVTQYCQITEYEKDNTGKVLSYKYLYKAADSSSNIHGHAITQKLLELINGHELVAVLDHTALNRKLVDYPTTYIESDGSIKGDIVAALESLKTENQGPYYSGFSNYGQDGYGRFLGCLYVKALIPDLPDEINGLIGEQWINVTKYLLYFFGDSFGKVSQELGLDFGTTPNSESMFNYISSAFKLWTYDKKRTKTVDLLDNISNESLTRQRELQKQILGVDFDSQLKDWTVMIGDCVFLVPPTSIRCVTRNNAESVPLIRSRGSAIKELPQSERIIEMTLYFNDESGINGVEIEHPAVWANDGLGETRRFDEKTMKPTGETVKYYMNGLRALLSMFKLCPFMPITNTYINDVLNVDAVALSALNIATMPNYPKCIAATIQLMEFNYHAYMSELPLTGEESGETIVHTNLFEKCIDFDTLRYYYQKPLYRGEVASRYAFDSDKYLELTYGAKTALQPITNFGDSSIEFYLPDSNYLNRQLQAKIESINNPLKTQYSLTDDVKEWAYELGKLYRPLQDYINSKNSEYNDFLDFLCNGPVDSNGKHFIDTVLFSYGPYKIGQSYSDFCKSVNPSGYKDKCNSRYHLTESNSYLKKYYNSMIGNTNITWHNINNSIHVGAPFDFDSMLSDDIIIHLSKHIYNANTHKSSDYLCSIAFNIEQSLLITNNSILNLAKNYSIDLGENYDNWMSDSGMLIIGIIPQTESNSVIIDASIENSIVYKLIELCYNQFTKYGRDDDGNIQEFGLPSDVMQDNVLADKQSTDVDTISTFRFEKYPNDDMLRSLIVTNISASVNNNLSRIYLKALDGYAPQYLGGQDTVIEISMVTQDAAAASAINILPKLCSEYMRNYHLILTSCPLRINTQFTRMIGVNEVLVETVDVSTVKNQPGLYEINMRLISVDRTVRNKEALKNIDVNNAGSRIVDGANNYTVRDYFDVRNKIAAAEIYPDLELPTIAELELYGFNFIRYKIFDSGRIYPDPDFYFIYGATTVNQIIRDTILTNLDKEYGNTESLKRFKYSDYIGGELCVDISQNGSPEQFTLDKTSMNNTATIADETITNAEKAISTFESYRTQLKLGKSKITYNDSSFSSTSVDNAISFINVLNNLGTHDYWHFSSNAKGLFREPGVKIDTEDIVVRTGDIYDLVNYILKEYKINSNDTNIPMLNMNPLSDNSTLNSLNNSYRNDIVKECESINEKFSAKHVHDSPDFLPLESIFNILYAIADAYSGNTIYVDDDDKFDKKSWSFNCFHGNDNIAFPIVFPNNESPNYIDNIFNYATSFGPFSIRMYPGSFIKTYFYKVYSNELSDSVKIDELYDDRRYFLNPYIMDHQHKYYKYLNGDNIASEQANDSKSIVDAYKYYILYNPKTIAAEAILNFNLYYLMLIKNEILISMTQIISSDSLIDDHLKDVMSKISDVNNTAVIYHNKDFTKFVSKENYDKSPESYKGYSEYKTSEFLAESLLSDQENYLKYVTKSEYYKDLADDISDSNKDVIDSVTQKLEDNFSDLIKKLRSQSVSLKRGNYLITAMLYIDGLDGELFNAVLNRDYTYLNDFLVSSSVAYSTPTQNTVPYKFLMALCGRKVIDSIEDIGSSDYTASDYAAAIINEYIELEATSDPYIYTRDSFYDMITTDMRGRMARAFPTFYLLFVDEGRDIGWWKLNDNFYNMSSINEITVTKSRKIAADTCTISMTNMFKTFTTDDEDGKEMSYDLETLSSFETSFRDVWDSIWSPRKLFLREYQERLEQNPIDRAQLKPGVRVHVRMGYGGDAYSLPCVFNGVVAEVTTGEVVNIVCQGDGVELSNPVIEDMTSSEDITNRDSMNFLWMRDIQNILTKGATPKTILTKFLTEKGRGIEKAINSLTKGRFFDDNPFGISHFGDPDFTEVFGNSECAQNIYEAIKSPLFNADDTYATRLQNLYSTKDVPKVSTQIYGKSFWDLMNVMASISPDYIAAVAPFGMRSTIFYGLPHYYYAYEYMKEQVAETVDDKTYYSYYLREKRKPYQQYHIYTSYGDIIENNISASSKYMKTNAVGIYYQNRFLSHTATKKVGPLYADIDIYSEYQKSMTVDTSYIANGVAIPIVSDVIPFLSSLTTDLGWFNDDEKIAWRITARALKDAVKEMYQGELITIGDPSVKPYDVAYINDVYDNIGGGCEVEAVTHILSAQTGFTTNIYVDPMVDIDNRYYQTAHSMASTVLKNTVAGYTAMFLTSLSLSKNTQPFTKLATHMVGNLTDSVSDSTAKILKFITSDNEFSKKAIGAIQGFNILGNTDIEMRYKELENVVNRFVKKKLDASKLNLNTANGISDVLERLDALNDIDTSLLSEFFNDKDTMDKLSKNALYKEKYDDIYKNIRTSLNKISSTRDSAVNNQLKAIVDSFKKIDGLANSADDVVLNAYKVLQTDINLNNINPHLDAIKTIVSNIEPGQITDDIKDILKTTVSTINSAGDNIAKTVTKTDDIIDALKAATYVARGSNPIILIASLAAELLIEAIIVGTVNNNITRFLRNLETLRIYPLTKNGKVFTAGLNGSKGIVVGSSTYDQQGWLQNTIMNVWENHPILTGIASLFLDTESFKEITDSWKNNNGMANSDENITQAAYKNAGLIASVTSEFANVELGMQNRIKVLYNNSNASDEDILNSTAAFKLNAVSKESLPYGNNLTNIETLSSLRSRMRSLLPSELRTGNLLMSFLHEHQDYSTGMVSVKINDNIVRLPYREAIIDGDNTYIDVPIVRKDVSEILYQFMNVLSASYPSFTTFDNKKIRMHIVNALIPDYFESWHSTGYSCNFFIENLSDEETSEILDYIYGLYGGIFEYSKINNNPYGNTIFNITVYPTISVGISSEYIVSSN